MIVLDIESSGLDSGKCGIWQIGALELENPGNTFLQEAKIDEEDEVNKEALVVTGKTEEELREKSKQPQKQLIENFLDWCKTCRVKMIAGQNVGWDVAFIQNKCIRYGIHDKFRDVIGQRVIDLHTLAQIRYRKNNGRFKLKGKGSSDMNLSNVMEFCGMEDKRIIVISGEIVKEGEPHNALTDAKLTAECLRSLLK